MECLFHLSKSKLSYTAHHLSQELHDPGTEFDVCGISDGLNVNMFWLKFKEREERVNAIFMISLLRNETGVHWASSSLYSSLSLVCPIKIFNKTL